MTRLAAVLLLGLALLAVACNVDRNNDGRFRVACWGDSQTKDGWQTGSDVRWCTLMATVLPTVGASSGGTFKDIPTEWENHAQLSASIFGVAVFQNGLPFQLTATSPDVDAVVAAFGTNDANSYATWTPQQAIAALQQTDSDLHAQGIQLWVATAPPSTLPAPQQAWQATFNELVRTTFCRWVDFTTGFEPYLQADGVHLDDAGQALRADRVKQALTTKDCA